MTRCDPTAERGDPTAAALEDVAFLARSVNRVTLLDALRRTAFERHELREHTSMSAPTFARILQELEERDWVERNGRQYRATTTGAFVVDGLLGAIGTVTTVHRLEALLSAVPVDAVSFDLETLSRARVTVAEPGAPLAPVRRFVSLTERSETLREVNATSIQHFDTDVLRCRLESGRRTELIYERRVVESLRSDHSETVDTLLESGETTLFAHESVPFGLSVFDERVGLCGYDRESGGLTVFVDTDDPDTRRWAETVYERYREEATPIVDDSAEKTQNPSVTRPLVLPSDPVP